MESTGDSLLSLLPPIRRARGWRLYAEDGRRFLDLWQDDGRGILGAKGTGIGTLAKAGVDRGLASPLPSVWSERLRKEVLRQYPEWQDARFFPDEGGARAWLSSHGLASPVLWPFQDFRRETLAGAEAAILRLPCPRALSPGLVLLKEGPGRALPQGPLVPPLLLSTAAKALGEFRGFLQSYTEAHWKKADRRLSSLMERHGPWLYPRCAPSDYPGLFRAALSAGVLLSPSHDLPSLVPGDFDDGEIAPLAPLGASLS